MPNCIFFKKLNICIQICLIFVIIKALIVLNNKFIKKLLASKYTL